MSNITLENWECGRGESARRPRGPKPATRGQWLKATAWLDGEMCWHNGALAWRMRGQIVVPDAAQIERAGRALELLRAREVALGERCENWRLARQLGALRASDFDKLCAVSRRRNPAALARLAPLLVLESLDVELPQSPARALLKAWPHSQKALKSVAENEDWPQAARALAAFVIGAAQPAAIAQLPKSSRSVAALGARFQAEIAAFEAPQLLLQMARADEEMARKIVALSASHAPFAPDASALQRLVKAHGLTAAWQIGVQLCSLENEWPASPNCLEFSAPAEEKLARETALLGRRARRDWERELGRILSRLALQAPAAIEPFMQLAEELRSAAVQAAARPSGKRKNRTFLKPGSVEARAFIAGVTAQMPIRLARLVQLALQTPDVAASLWLWREVAQKCRNDAPIAGACRKNAGESGRKWAKQYGKRLQREAEFLARLARVAGTDFARWAWERGRHRELSNGSRHLTGHRKPAPAIVASWIELLKELPALSGVALWEWSRLHQRLGPAARGFMAALLDATRAAPTEARASLIEGIFWTLPATSEARGSWRYLPAMMRESAEILSECGDNIAGAADAVAELAHFCQRLDIEPALRAPLARVFATVYRAHLKSRDWPGQPDLICEIALRLCHQSSPDSPDENRIADFERTLRHAFEAFYADRDSSKTVRPALEIVHNRPALARALRYGLEVAPVRALSAMEHLVALSRAHRLEELQPLENSVDSLDSSWDEIVKSAPASAEVAREFVRCQRLIGENDAPPPGALKIGDWPRKWAREIEALQSKVAANPTLLPRLDNLRARLADEPKWRAQQAEELKQLLENATKRAAFAALERAIERGFRARLQQLCGELPAHFAFDDDWFNALLLSGDVEYNRKWARALLRHEVAGTPHWREQLPGNAQFLSELSARGIDADFYLSEFGRARGELWLWLETKPLGILQMGNRFNTCLSRGSCNAFAGVANAIELNKRVVYARDKNGRIVARQLWAVSEKFELLGFHIYSTFSDDERAGLDAHFAAHAREFARSCGLELADAGAVEKLVAPDWYDDGARKWERGADERTSRASVSPL